jgi:hypothetical protein
MEMLGDLTANYNGIPRSYYRFEPRAIDNNKANKAPLPPTNDSARGEFD